MAWWQHVIVATMRVYCFKFAHYIFFLGALFVCIGFQGNSASAQSPNKRFKSPVFDVTSGQDAGFGSSVDRMISDTTNIHLYDPITLDNLKRMRDQAAPQLNEYDIEADKVQRLVEKALAIQTGKSLVDVVNQSDLRETYTEVKSWIKAVQDTVRYSVQNDGTSYSVSRKTKGKKLVEINLEFSSTQLFDPQLRIGDNFRFRYDYSNDAPILEYRVGF